MPVSDAVGRQSPGSVGQPGQTDPRVLMMMRVSGQRGRVVASMFVLVLSASCSKAGDARVSEAAQSTASQLPVAAHSVVGWCSARDLAPVAVGEPSGLAGSMGYYLLARNETTRPCRVQGFPDPAQALLPTGWRPFRFFHGTPLDGDYTAASYVIPANGSMVVDLVADHSRGYKPAVRWLGVRLRLPHVAAWITWRGHVEPDSGVGLGPAKLAD